MMSRKFMSPVDLAWLRMDDPNNLMIITGIMVFETKLDVERFKDAIRGSLLKFRRFRQRIVQPRLPLMRPYWEDDPYFALEEHLEHVTLTPPGDQAALHDLVSVVMSTDLDRSRPLWHFYIVDDYQDGSALVVRLHHCIADGIALIQVLLSMTDLEPDAVREYDPVELAQRDRPTRGDGGLTLRRELKNAVHLSSRALGEGFQMLTDREHAAERLTQARDFTAAVARLALRWPDPPTPFKGELGYQKRAAWSHPVDLDQVKLTGKAFGGTVNDILLTAVSGALRRYLLERDEPVEGLDIRGFIPVNLRPNLFEEELGNKFGLVFLSLPLGIDDPLERLLELKRNMDDLKASYEAIAAYGVLGVMGVVPPRIQDIAVSIFDTKGTAVMTNVPGPRQTLYMAGAPIKTIMAWVPQSGRISLGVSIISYEGQVYLGVATDAGLVPDPEHIIALFESEFKAMLERAQALQTRRKESVKPMLAGLDSALRDLDEILEVTRKTAIDEQAEASFPERCQALTKSGRQCKNPALPGQAFCHIHIRQSSDSLEQD